MRQRSRGIGAAALTAMAMGTVGAGVAPAAEAASCVAPAPLEFADKTFVDTTRAGGEPLVQTHPSGALLYTAHAGTTHVYGPAAADPDTAAFAQNYTGQTYIWRSEDGGKSWKFVPRILPRTDNPGAVEGVAMSGFSDSELAIDTAGNMYESEINLVNVAVSKSSDIGKTWTLQNFFGFTLTDRQWKSADEEDVVYMVGNATSGGTFPTDPVGNSGHILIKSVDGGATWSEPLSDGGGLGDIYVDQNDGRLYETHYSGGSLMMKVFDNIRGIDDPAAANRSGMLEADRYEIAEGVRMLAHWPSMDIDGQGNLYVTWDESGTGARPAGVYYASSTDKGRTWSDPVKVDRPNTDDTDNTSLWPWLTVGDAGRVAIAWLEADRQLPGNDGETSGTHKWRIHTAVTTSGLGCAGSDTAGFAESVATTPVHTGTMCQGGTICQALGIDRRLGDFFSIDADNDGNVYMGYSDTSSGGSVALPGFSRQTGGPKLFVK